MVPFMKSVHTLAYFPAQGGRSRLKLPRALDGFSQPSYPAALPAQGAYCNPSCLIAAPYQGNAAVFGRQRDVHTEEREGSCLQAKERGILRNQSCWYLGLPASETVRKTWLLFKLPNLCYFVTAVQTD